jgi:hypothetical protein
MGETPFGSCVCDAEAVAFGVPLGFAAGFGDHHGEVASQVGCVLQPGGEDGSLGSLAAGVGNGAGSGEKCHAIVNDEAAGGDGAAGFLDDESDILFGGEHHASQVHAPAFGNGCGVSLTLGCRRYADGEVRTQRGGCRHVGEIQKQNTGEFQGNVIHDGPARSNSTACRKLTPLVFMTQSIVEPPALQALKQCHRFVLGEMTSEGVLSS